MLRQIPPISDAAERGAQRADRGQVEGAEGEDDEAFQQCEPKYKYTYIYIYMYIHHIYIYICIHTYIHTYLPTYLPACLPA